MKLEDLRHWRFFLMFHIWDFAFLIHTLDNVASMIFNAAPEDVNFIWVAAIVESPENIVRVTVFATDFAD